MHWTALPALYQVTPAFGMHWLVALTCREPSCENQQDNLASMPSQHAAGQWTSAQQLAVYLRPSTQQLSPAAHVMQSELEPTHQMLGTGRLLLALLPTVLASSRRLLLPFGGLD